MSAASGSRDSDRRSSHSGRGSASVNATANTTSPLNTQEMQRRHSLDERPKRATQGPSLPLEPIDFPSIQPSSTPRPILAENLPSPPATQDHRSHRQSFPSASDSDVPAPSSAIKALLAAGAATISITTEREHSDANPNNPAFLKGVTFDSNNPKEWFETVLPYVECLTLNIASSSDIHFAGSMFGSRHLPRLHLAITKLQLPGFYWFSGVQHNRLHNPYMQLARNLVNLRELTFTMHTAAVTTSAFSERQMIAIEKDDLSRSKERRCMRPSDVFKKYELDGLFQCTSLRRVCIEYIECEMTSHFCRVGNPFNVCWGIQARLMQGFARQRQQVLVELIPTF